MSRLGDWWRRVTAPAEAAPGAPTVPHDAVVIPQAPRAAALSWGVPPECVDLSAAFEGYRAAPYQCAAGVWTIGHGSTRDIHGKPVTRATPAVTEAQASYMAARDLEHAASLMALDFPKGLPPRWWAVGVLMCNNMGRMSVWGPTLMLLLREAEWQKAAGQMRHYRNAGGKPSLGLRRRRWAEAAYALGVAAGEARRRAWEDIRGVDDWPALPS